jgi:hypothetical protein
MVAQEGSPEHMRRRALQLLDAAKVTFERAARRRLLVEALKLALEAEAAERRGRDRGW